MSYFKNIEGLGDLELGYKLFEAGYPVLFTCKDSSQRLFLCWCCDIRGEQRWVITETTDVIIIAILMNKLTLHEAFMKLQTEIYLVSSNKEGTFSTIARTYYDINQSYLPKSLIILTEHLRK